MRLKFYYKRKSGRGHRWSLSWEGPMEFCSCIQRLKIEMKRFLLKILWNTSMTSFGQDYKGWEKQKKKKIYIYIYIAFSLFLCRTQYWFKLVILGTSVPPLTGILNAGWRQVAEVKTMAVLLLLLLLSRFSRVWLCATPKTAANQALPSLGFSRQEHWRGLPFPSPMDESEKWKWSCSVVSDS